MLIACDGGHTAVVAILLKNKANIEAVSKVANECSGTPSAVFYSPSVNLSTKGPVDSVVKCLQQRSQ